MRDGARHSRNLGEVPCPAVRHRPGIVLSRIRPSDMSVRAHPKIALTPSGHEPDTGFGDGVRRGTGTRAGHRACVGRSGASPTLAVVAGFTGCLSPNPEIRTAAERIRR